MKFTMTDEQLETIFDACKPVMCIKIGNYTPRSPQENANDAWAKLGLEMGFDPTTVNPGPGEDQKTFFAEPLCGKVEVSDE